MECSAEREEVTPLASEIILTVSERRNRQKLTLSSTAAPFVFGRGRDCSFVLRRNNVGEHQFTIEYKNNAWLMQDAGSTTCGTWYNNRYIHSGEEVTLQPGDVIGLNTDGNETTQEITFRVEEIRQGEGTAALRRETPNATVLRELDVRRKRRILIGRGEDCDVQLTSDRVSRHHCEVVYKDGHYELNDLGSTNGTYLNGTRVRNELLTDGAVINVPTQVFAFSGGDPDTLQAGPSLMFITIPKVFANMGLGTGVGILFFLLVLFAALTSSIALTESAVATFEDELGWGRKKSTVVIGLIMIGLGTLSSLGYGPLGFVKILGMQFLDLFDFLTNSVMMPIAAFVTSLLVSRVVGIDKIEEEIRHGESKFRRKKIFVVMIKYLCPIFALIILLSSVANAFGWISM